MNFVSTQNIFVLLGIPVSMGCTSSKSLPPSDFDSNRGRMNAKPAYKGGQRIEVGRPVDSGPIDPQKRAAQLAAAEKRAIQEANRGLGAGSVKAIELSESARKQELIGRIQAVYQSQNREVPMGLTLASVEQLKNHLETIRNNQYTK